LAFAKGEQKKKKNLYANRIRNIYIIGQEEEEEEEKEVGDGEKKKNTSKSIISN